MQVGKSRSSLVTPCISSSISRLACCWRAPSQATKVGLPGQQLCRARRGPACLGHLPPRCCCCWPPLPPPRCRPLILPPPPLLHPSPPLHQRLLRPCRRACGLNREQEQALAAATQAGRSAERQWDEAGKGQGGQLRLTYVNHINAGCTQVKAAWHFYCRAMGTGATCPSCVLQLTSMS